MDYTWKRAVWVAFSMAATTTFGIYLDGWANVANGVKLAGFGEWLTFGGLLWYGLPPEGWKP